MTRKWWMAVLAAGVVAIGGQAVQAEQPLMKDLVGINGHTVAFKPKLYAPVCRIVRDYHPMAWDLGKDTSQLPKWPMAENRVDWQHVYGSWRQENWNIDVCLMFSAIKPDAWKDMSKDAEAYARTFAAEFGPDGKLPYVSSAEIGNEPSYTDEEYTKIFDAMSRGLRAGDPKLKILTCNVKVDRPKDKYSKSVALFESRLNEFDVISTHIYSQLNGWPTWDRTYPEDPRLDDYLGAVDKLAEWRDKHCPDKPIWITEFGYDSSTKKPDPKTEWAKWAGNKTDKQQAQYLVRSELLFSAMPVERAYIYFFNDEDTPHMHGSSGITRNFVPKPSYWALADMMKVLGNCRYIQTLAKTESVYAYEFQDATNSARRVVAVWSPTEGDKTSTWKLDVPGYKIVQATGMPLADEPAPVVKVDDGTVPVSESPLYVELRRTE